MARQAVNLAKTQNSRMFLIENRAGPANAPTYQGLWRAGAVSWPQGDVTLVRIPDPDQYGAFDVVDKIPGEQGAPSLTVTARMTMDLSVLLQLVRNGCDHDLQIHFGTCKNPRDFDRGWQKVAVLEGASITDYGTGDLGALDTSERAVINEEVPFSGEDYYELKNLNFATKAAAQTVREVVGITFCDSASCGICGLPSDGCQVIFAVTKSSDSSPGLVAELIWTKDGGLNWYDMNITTLGATEDPSGVLCVGSNVIVISAESGSLHYAPISEITNADDDAATWAEMLTGFAVGGAPRAISSASPVSTWIVGAGGYIYWTADPASSVTVQDAGSATGQDLNDVYALDDLNVIAVGAANAVVYTANGGETWAAVTGPAVGVALNAVHMVDADTWWVGTAGGRLYYTINAGVTWVEKSFAGSGAGVVRDIVFVNDTVGYMAHSTATPAGRIFRTINGGYSWYLLPEDTNQAIPANDYISTLAVCPDPNKVVGAGLGDDALDGIIVLGG